MEGLLVKWGVKASLVSLSAARGSLPVVIFLTRAVA